METKDGMFKKGIWKVMKSERGKLGLGSKRWLVLAIFVHVNFYSIYLIVYSYDCGFAS